MSNINDRAPNGRYVDVLFTCGVVLVLSGVGTVLRRGMGLSYRNYVALQGEHLITQLLRANGRLLLALSTQRMAYPSRKWGCGVSRRFHLVVFAIGVNQEKWETVGSPRWPTNGRKLLRRSSSSYKKLLDRVAFWIVYKIVAYNATSVGVGR